jgi:protein-disulfide isomerase
MRIDVPKVQTGAPAVRGAEDERDHILGEAAADVRVILYSDTECPFCNSFHDYSLPKILDEYGSRVALVYRHYPIVTLHPNARIEADATECAYEQKGHEGFWALLDALYSAIDKENTFDIAQIPRLAQEAGLDPARLEKCIDSGQGDAWVKKNMDQATTVGVYKTPTVYVENVKTGKSVLIAGAGFTATKAAIEIMLQSVSSAESSR